jgi:hypothetical protein
VGNQDILTYAGSKDPCYKDRRKEVKCGGCCASEWQDLPLKLMVADMTKTYSRTLDLSKDFPRAVTNIRLRRLLRAERELTKAA